MRALSAGTVVAASLVTLSPVPGSAQSTDLVLSGYLTEAGADRRAIVGATVQLGAAVRTTDGSGSFTFIDLSPGRIELAVTALGYAPFRVVLELRADTTLFINLTPAPILLDSLVARSRDITIRGKVTAHATGEPLWDAIVYVSPDGSDRTNFRGDFRIGDIPAGPPALMEVAAYGYAPRRFQIVTDEDMRLLVQMALDSVTQRMIGVQLERLAQRVSDLPANARLFRLQRDSLRGFDGWSVADVLRQRMRRARVGLDCAIIDDRRVRGMGPIMEVLYGYRVEEIERIEMIEVLRPTAIRPSAIARIYTRGFIQRMLTDTTALPPISVALDCW